MTKNELQALGAMTTRALLKTLPKDYTGDILSLAKRGIAQDKTVNEILQSNPSNIEDVKAGMNRAVKDYLSNK
jgi:hypothetical protein